MTTHEKEAFCRCAVGGKYILNGSKVAWKLSFALALMLLLASESSWGLSQPVDGEPTTNTGKHWRLGSKLPRALP